MKNVPSHDELAGLISIIEATMKTVENLMKTGKLRLIKGTHAWEYSTTYLAWSRIRLVRISLAAKETDSYA